MADHAGFKARGIGHLSYRTLLRQADKVPIGQGTRGRDGVEKVLAIPPAVFPGMYLCLLAAKVVLDRHYRVRRQLLAADIALALISSFTNIHSSR